MTAHKLKDEDLHAYVDGWLDGDRRLAVERWLADDPEAARKVEDYRAQAALLHEIFDPVLREEHVPETQDLADRLKGRIAGNDNRPAWYAKPWVRMAAAVMLLVSGAAGGYFGRGASIPSPAQQQQRQNLLTFAEEAAQAHRFYTADERYQVEMGADDPGALDSFLSQRVGKEVFGPDLSKVGYRLVGGRSLPTDLGAGAQYMYINDQGKRITLFAGSAPQGQNNSFSFAQKGDVATFYWVEGQLAYALIGRLSRDELLGITKAVYDDVKAGRRLAPPPPQQQQQQNPEEKNPDQQRRESEQGNGVQPVSDTHKPKDS
ncbi:anti-sigma factor family protein [Azospirillum sp.]|uniref:anti-sigma factor family protein n=1 Tax=Azospirillum sp. TaxID=34012 RepID=UPI003D736491